jgi:5-methylcytosine-specific restriction enzyme A
VKPLHECGNGCRILTRERRCPKHTIGDNERKQYDRARNKWDPFRALYKTARWQWLKRVVKMDEPICKCCGLAKSDVVDHIIPARVYAAKDSERFYDRANIQGLCKPCHDEKTRHEMEEYGLSSPLSGATRL